MIRLLLVAGLLVVAAPPAWAGPSCSSGRHEDAYQTGRAQGRTLVESAWLALGQECAQLGHLQETVLEALDRLVPPDGASESTRCRYQGVEDGAGEELAEIAAACQGS